MNEQRALPFAEAARAVGHCVVVSAGLLRRRQVHLSSAHKGLSLRFGDGSTATVYRETVLRAAAPRDPCVLVVEFRLRGVRGRGHALFRWESLFNTPLFVGFPGFVSKLWLAHDDRGTYRGLYEWDGTERAEGYARALWRVLALVSVRGSIHYRVLPGLRRDEIIEWPGALGGNAVSDAADWWRPVGRV